MKYSDLVVKIKELNLPSVYHHWEKGEAPNLPYIVHLMTDRDDESADNINYFKVQGVAIELYSRNSDFENEKKIETMLTELGFFYETDESIFADNMYLKRYEITLKGEI